MDKHVLGTITHNHEADYEHNFHLSNQTCTPVSESETRIHEIVNQIIQPLRQELTTVKTQLNKLNASDRQHQETLLENKLLKEKILQLECYSRRSNLKFFGYKEQRGESKFDCKRAIPEHSTKKWHTIAPSIH